MVYSNIFSFYVSVIYIAFLNFCLFLTFCTLVRLELVFCPTGVPKSELMGGLRTSSKLPLTWTAEELRQYIMSLFPRVRSFVYMKCNQGKTLDPLPDDLKPSDLRTLLGRSGLYIMPNSPLLPKVCGTRQH